jgi:hypothetical protein
MAQDYLLRQIDPELWRQVKSKAALERLTIRELIEQLLRQWLYPPIWPAESKGSLRFDDNKE